MCGTTVGEKMLSIILKFIYAIAPSVSATIPITCKKQYLICHTKHAILRFEEEKSEGTLLSNSL